ncbi:hypothetical protein B0H14DRAFT_2187109, partial [Mycena olivaceomarginata]
VVMPYGRRFNHPAFHCRAEFVDAMRQFLEGLAFFHDHNICHQCVHRLIMDDSRVVPHGSHFCLPKPTPESQELWNGKTASPSVVGYFYIDFGPSMRFPKGRDTASGDTPKAFETIPELSDTAPYNPFKVNNIFQLG